MAVPPLAVPVSRNTSPRTRTRKRCAGTLEHLCVIDTLAGGLCLSHEHLRCLASEIEVGNELINVFS